MSKSISFPTLIMMISFASVNAVLSTPALPDISNFFAITDQLTQTTITLFLIGYAFGQLLYGPIANRYGRKPALYVGISLQILSSFICVASGYFHQFLLLELGRFFLAIGAGVGLKITYVYLNECYDAKTVGQKISYLMLAFAITPGLAVALGGFLNKHYGWTSCFYASAAYGLAILSRVRKLPETLSQPDYDALKIDHLLANYKHQFTNYGLVFGGILMGLATCFVYLFAAVAPFIAMDIYHMNSADYGLANLIPSIGLIMGSIINANLAKKIALITLLKKGVYIAILGSFLMLMLVYLKLNIIYAIFMPMMIIYLGLCMVLANASTPAMTFTNDKAHGSAVMNFINMSMATLLVLTAGYFHITPIILPICFLGLGISMVIIFGLTLKTTQV